MWWQRSIAESPASSKNDSAESLYQPSKIPKRGNSQSPIIMPFSTILVVSAFGFGFLSGVMSGARHTALVYLTENAHRRPETVQGWYFYNKTKYYRMMMGGVKQGSRTGLKLTGWVGGWCLLDVLSEDARKYLAEKQQESEMPHGSSVISKLGHWSDGALAGAVTGLIGSIACAYFSFIANSNRSSIKPYGSTHASFGRCSGRCVRCLT